MLCYKPDEVSNAVNGTHYAQRWAGKCWGCDHGKVETFTSVRCLVTGKLRTPCHECDAIDEERSDKRVDVSCR